MLRYACLWSGGKDSCYACYQALKSGAEIAVLVNFVGEDGLSRSHRLPAPLLGSQARKLRLPMVQAVVNREDYRRIFIETLQGLRASSGISGIVAGDLDLQEHRDWLKTVCAEVGVDLWLPLWHREPWSLLHGFIADGFRAVLVALKAGLFDREWLGRFLDEEFLGRLRSLQENNGLHPCGESGEYHTLVVDGPLFRETLTIVRANSMLKEGYWTLDILEYR